MYEDLLKAELTALRLDVRDLSIKVKTLERENATLSENQLIQLRLINDLRGAARTPPMRKDRGEILLALLAANGGKMLRQEARKIMRMPENRFSELLKSMGGKVETRASKLKPREKLLLLK